MHTASFAMQQTDTDTDTELLRKEAVCEAATAAKMPCLIEAEIERENEKRQRQTYVASVMVDA